MPRDNGVDVADEQTPLLASEAQDPANRVNEAEVISQHNHDQENGIDGADKSADEDVPLPMGQIFVLCIARVVDPISFFSIFPFVPKMVEMMHIPEEEVGFYTGIIESLFSIVQVLTMFWWGKAADRYGRKPVLVISLFGVATASTLFGTSRTIWQMILWRSAAGLFSGSVISIRAMFHEVSTPKTTARAFSYFAFAGNLGIFAGPAIGSLARPADQYPNVFGHIQFFHDWPYMLPTAIIGLIGFIGAVSTLLFVKETLPEELRQKAKSKQEMSTWKMLKYPGVAITIINFMWVGMLGFAFTAVVPVYFYTSVAKGGFGLPENLISLLISLNGIAQALWLLIVFPPLHRRIGTKRLLQGCGVFWPVFICFFPINNFFLRQHWKNVFWTVAPTVQTIGSAVAMAFTGVQLAVNEASPSPELLGTLNGVALTLQSLTRAITPTVYSSIYAAGVKKHILGGQLGMLLIALVAGFYLFLASMLPAPKIESERHLDSDVEDD